MDEPEDLEAIAARNAELRAQWHARTDAANAEGRARHRAQRLAEATADPAGTSGRISAEHVTRYFAMKGWRRTACPDWSTHAAHRMAMVQDIAGELECSIPEAIVELMEYARAPR